MEIIRSTVGNWNTAQLQGPFTVKTIRSVQEVIDTVLCDNLPLLVLNLVDVSYMDSSAIGVLLAANRRYTQKGGKLALVEANESITEIFDTIKLNKHIPVYHTYDAFVATI